jgi:hypothetical protein
VRTHAARHRRRTPWPRCCRRLCARRPPPPPPRRAQRNLPARLCGVARAGKGRRQHAAREAAVTPSPRLPVTGTLGSDAGRAQVKVSANARARTLIECTHKPPAPGACTGAAFARGAGRAAGLPPTLSGLACGRGDAGRARAVLRQHARARAYQAHAPPAPAGGGRS